MESVLGVDVYFLLGSRSSCFDISSDFRETRIPWTYRCNTIRNAVCRRLAMPSKRTRIIVKTLGLILLALVLVCLVHRNQPRESVASIGVATGALVMFLFEEFK